MDLEYFKAIFSLIFYATAARYSSRLLYKTESALKCRNTRAFYFTLITNFFVALNMHISKLEKIYA